MSRVSTLDTIHGPADLRRLPASALPDLAAEIRARLVRCVSRTGGHLGPNLGVVELTIALHRVFDSPRDAIVWDTGHQSYVHKMLTGRAGDLDRLRQPGGLSGYPRRAESPHDLVEKLARVHRTVLCGRSGQGLRAARRVRPYGGGRGG